MTGAGADFRVDAGAGGGGGGVRAGLFYFLMLFSPHGDISGAFY